MNKVRVILVEEHAILSEIIREFIARMPDVEVLAEVRDGREVPELVQRLEPDILIVDIHLHGVSSAEIIRKLTDAKRHVQILVLADFADWAFLQLFLGELNVSGYILKDEGLEILVKAIRSIALGELEWLKERASYQLEQVIKDSAGRKGNSKSR